MYQVKGYVKQAAGSSYPYIDQCRASVRHHLQTRGYGAGAHYAHTNCMNDAVLVVDGKQYCALHAEQQQRRLNEREMLMVSEKHESSEESRRESNE